MKKLLLLVILAAMTIGVAVSAQPAMAKEWTIAIMPKLIGIPYFNASEVGSLQAGKDMGLNVKYGGPTNADATTGQDDRGPHHSRY